MTNTTINFFDVDTLIDRLVFSVSERRKPIVFLLGAPVSVGLNGMPGVPDVTGIVELIREVFRDDANVRTTLERELMHASANVYQGAISFLQGRRGQDAVNHLIQRAVLKARVDSNDAYNLLRAAADSNVTARALETEHEKWVIPGPLSDLAKLVTAYPDTFGRLQLTTNFDPLLSLALQGQNGQSFRSTLSRDGALNQVQGDGCHIVHLHGFWRGVDTLHTPRQLSQPRPRLKSSLANLLKDSIVVPIAYGGWDDVFTRTLVEVVEDEESRPEILWTFWGENAEELINRHADKLELFTAGLDSGRLQLYKGVDCQTIFGKIALRLGIDASMKGPSSPLLKAVTDPLEHAFDEIALQARNDNVEERSVSDAIPSVAELIGRSTEFKILDDSDNQLVSISGIGGQGKTSLAASYALECRRRDDFSFVDWRDCREQKDTLHTIFLRLAHTLFEPSISISTLKDLTIEQLIEGLIRVLVERRGLLVLDNVDQYIDLESGQPLGALKTLIDFALEVELKSKIIITARPVLTLGTPRAIELPLKGLAHSTARQLFEHKSTKQISDTELDQLQELTNGHPLWISLIGSRFRHGNTSIHDVLTEIGKGKGDLPERTLSSNWRVLNDKQKTVLRTIAELERPLPEEDICQIDFELNYNQFSRALRALKSLSLVEVSKTDGGLEMLDLHPLVRQYVRKNFPKLEREKFISRIILVLDRKLSALRQMFASSLPNMVLEVWTHKVDLSLNSGDVVTAIDSLIELEDPLVDAGMAEEFIRLCTRLFEQGDWVSLSATYSNFNKVWAAAMRVMTQFGEDERARVLTERYAESIEGRGPQFVNLCNSRCYQLWFAGDFAHAVFWGEQGRALTKTSQADIGFDCSHNLALAWRDDGRVAEALEYFLGDSEEGEVLDPAKLDHHRKGSFYGNIGRCYHLDGDLDKALVCYKKCGLLLEAASDDLLNRGYIRQWAGQAFAGLRKHEDAAYFLRAANEMWRGYVPKRAANIETEIQLLLDDHPDVSHVMKEPSWRLENRFMQWVNA